MELRHQILAEVLGDSILHITQLQKRLGHVRCSFYRREPEDCTTGLFGDFSRSCIGGTPQFNCHYYMHTPKYQYDENPDFRNYDDDPYMYMI